MPELQAFDLGSVRIDEYVIAVAIVRLAFIPDKIQQLAGDIGIAGVIDLEKTATLRLDDSAAAMMSSKLCNRF